MIFDSYSPLFKQQTTIEARTGDLPGTIAWVEINSQIYILCKSYVRDKLYVERLINTALFQATDDESISMVARLSNHDQRYYMQIETDNECFPEDIEDILWRCFLDVMLMHGLLRHYNK